MNANNGKSRWGFDESVLVQKRVEPVPMIPTTPAVNTEAQKVISVQNKSIDALSNTVKVLTTEKEKLQNQLYAKDSQLETITQKLSSAYEKITKLETEQSSTRYNSERLGQANLCQEVTAPNTFGNGYGYPTHPTKSATPSISEALASTYRQPTNPMTVFVEFLEELNILEDYMKILMADGNSMETLCGQHDPSNYIDYICIDDDGDMLNGWDEADALWQEICEADSLDDHEAYVE